MTRSNPVKRADAVLYTGLPDDAIAMDAGAFDNLLHNRGVRLIHHRAIRCPVGLQDENDIHRTHADHSGCQNGFIYKPIGRVTTLFTSNTMDPRKLDQGFFDGSSVVVTFPRFYDETEKRVLVRPFDRFYLEEESVVTAIWDLTHRRRDGLNDRVEFPVRKAEHVVDSTGKWWYQDQDFAINAVGEIVWAAERGPAPGTVYSVWYEYRPYWYCDRLLHEIRVTPVPDPIQTDLVGVERLSFGAALNREYVYRNEQNDEQAPDNRGRKQRPPDALSTVSDTQDDYEA